MLHDGSSNPERKSIQGQCRWRGRAARKCPSKQVHRPK